MPTIDPVAYLRATAPFHALPEERFAVASYSLEVTFLPAGTAVVRKGGRPLEHLYVIRKGAVRLERDGQLLQILEEGECFGYTSLLTDEATLDVTVEDDLLAYRIPAEAFRSLLADAAFARHFAGGLADRLRASLDHSPVATFRPDLNQLVGELVRRPPLWVEADATVGDAARLMRDEKASSVLVRGSSPGIVTDRDFRSRVLAVGLGPEAPLAKVCSRPLRTVAAETPMYEAWRLLLETGLHHLPITRGEEIAGVITSTDLLKATAQGPVALLRSVERLGSREALPGYAGKVTEMVASSLAGGLDAIVVSGLVARLNDALVRRILHWAEEALGPAPAEWAWIVFGSEGRMEQAILTDQDNALVFADEGTARRDWFQAFAERANDDLEAAGFPRCRGGYMARRWNGPLGDWAARFRGWAREPTTQAMLESSIFFDFRRVAGGLPLDALEAEVAEAARQQTFLRMLAQTALRFRPPASLVLRLRGGDSEVDLKNQGISPIVCLARCYGLEVGCRAPSTLERLDGARAAGLMGESVHATVSEAYRFLLGLRLRLQLRRLHEGKPTGNTVALAELSAIERGRVKEAFRAIRSWQEKAAYHFHAEL